MQMSDCCGINTSSILTLKEDEPPSIGSVYSILDGDNIALLAISYVVPNVMAWSDIRLSFEPWYILSTPNLLAVDSGRETVSLLVQYPLFVRR